MHCHGVWYLFQHDRRMVHLCTHIGLLRYLARRQRADDVQRRDDAYLPIEAANVG